MREHASPLPFESADQTRVGQHFEYILDLGDH